MSEEIRLHHFKELIGLEPRNINILFIGLEGTSILTGHQHPQLLIKEIESFGSGHTARRRGWRSLDDSERHTTMKKFTRADKIKGEAIEYLARLIHERFIHLIIATDDASSLSDLLSEKLRMLDSTTSFKKLSFQGCRFPLIAQACEDVFQRPLLLDCGDLILKGLQIGYYDFNKKDIIELIENLKKTIGMHRHINLIVWGWCAENIRLNDIIKEIPEKYYVIGYYSESADISHSEPIIVKIENSNVPSDSPINYSSNDIISWGKYFLGDINESKEKTVKIPSSINTAIPAHPKKITATRSSAAETLLIEERRLAEILDIIRRNVITVVGIDGVFVRSRVVSKIQERLISENKLVVNIPSNIDALSHMISSAPSQLSPKYVITNGNHFVGPELGNILARTKITFTSAVSPSRDDKDELANDCMRFAIFTSVKCARFQLRYNLPSRIQIQPLDLILNRSDLGNWLSERVQAVGNIPVAPRNLEDLTNAMLEEAGSSETHASDWLHQQLDIWHLYLTTELETREMANLEELTTLCLEIWRQVVALQPNDKTLQPRERKRERVTLDFADEPDFRALSGSQGATSGNSGIEGAVDSNNEDTETQV